MEEADIVLFSSSSADIYQKAQRFIPDHFPTWVLHRLFEPRRLKVLMQIPSGTEVLVINNLYGTCQEVIQTLLEAHMDHLIYVPFYPGGVLEHEQYRYAITLGIPDVLPPDDVELIEIGIRHIHVHDLIELGRRLGVPLEREKQYLSAFIADIHEMGKELGESFVDIQNLHTHLQSIFEAVQEPIFAVDQHGNITFMNQMASELFQCQGRNWIGQPIFGLAGMDVIQPFIQSTFSNHEALVTIREQHFIVNCKRMERNQVYQGTVCMLKNVTEIQSLERRLRKAIVDKGHVASYTFDQIIGQSPPLMQAISKAKKMAKNNRNILITGENGTGKELFAHSIHLESPRRNGPFVAINCASFPENLQESEIFGYEEGAFTGARKGLQEKQVVRVGATNVLSVDVRVIEATNKNLEEAVKRGRFREDFYYRLNVLPIPEGGTQPSTVADTCTVQIDRRYVPSETLEQVIGEIQEVIDRLAAEDPQFHTSIKLMESNAMKHLSHVPMMTAPDHAIVAAVTQAVECVTDRKPSMSTRRGWTDGGLLSHYLGIPTIICGPGDISYSHSKNERIAVQELVQAVEIYVETAIQFCGVKLAEPPS